MRKAGGNRWCEFDGQSKRCARCGFLAPDLPFVRECLTLEEMAEDVATYSMNTRIRLPPIPIGTGIAWVLSRLGINKEWLSKKLGRDCGCGQRQDSLDRIGQWISESASTAANRFANAVLPATPSQADVAAVLMAMMRDGTVNQGLRQSAGSHLLKRPTGGPPAPSGGTAHQVDTMNT